MKTEVGFYKMKNNRCAVITCVDVTGYGRGYFQTPGADVVKGTWCPDGKFIAWPRNDDDLNLKRRLV